MMLSTVILTVVAPLATVSADSTESKIEKQDSKIVSIKDEAAQAEAQELAAQQSLVVQQEKSKETVKEENKVENIPTLDIPPVIDDEGDEGSNIDKPQPPIPTPPPTNPSPTNPYPPGQCTAYVWDYFGGKIPTYLGNAGDWIVYANSGPAVGTIAVFPPGNQGAGGVGHVAVVISVSGSTMRVKEGNFNGGWGTERDCSTEGVSFIRP